jgi:HEAT repeat protein
MTDSSPEVDLAKLAARAADVADERELAQLRHAADEAIEEAARSDDFRQRAIAFRAVGQMRFRAKTELLRRGLEDDSPACRGSAVLSLELLSRDHPRVVNQVRPLLHQLANADPNAAVRRLAVLALKNTSPQPDTIVLLDHLAASDEEDRELRQAAAKVVEALKKKTRERARHH